ncbi:PAS domain-containing protein [Robertkochia aurantiaca]|uniref:PAS domain-containing protein n=1 Tax=Robertkochia aurantiaca TaxID=2873700 RepID=UPI001CC90F5D|nr:PAS domain-containing protein [Robertkochia sp. 3YJGBD-33]
MGELAQYDAGVRRYYEKRGPLISFPLKSFDFHMQQLLQWQLSGQDLERLRMISSNWNREWDFEASLRRRKEVIVITDTSLKIVFSSYNMQEMSGYVPQEIIGKSPKMFQGEMTCEATSSRIREAIQNRTSFRENIVNYKKNGAPYKCEIKGYPVFDQSGKLVNFIAFEKAA